MRDVDQENPLADRLRDRILNALHSGALQPGERLPSIRTLSHETSCDHRAVAQAYRVLEAEGLVEIRGRSGVYVAPQDGLGGELLAETARWMAGIFVEGWKRHIPVTELPDLLRRCTWSRPLRCACVESTLDEMVAYCGELREQFALEPVPVFVSPVPLPRPERSIEYFAMQDQLRTADLIVTSVYHARMVRKAAEDIGKPVIILAINQELNDDLKRHVGSGPVTVLAVDPVFAERLRTMFTEGQAEGERIRFVPTTGPEALRHLPAEEPVLATRAAREAVGELPNPLLVPHSPTLSAKTAREILEVMIELNACVRAGAHTADETPAAAAEPVPV